MPRKLTDEFFENRSEQARIKGLLLEAIPADVFYHNLVIALSDLLRDMIAHAFKESVYRKSVKKRDAKGKP